MSGRRGPACPGLEHVRRVHLVYPHGPGISTPNAIGRQVGQALEARYEVVYHDWDDTGAITPEHGDALVGHPHPAPWTIFRRSAKRQGWSRVIMLAPFSPGDPRQFGFADRVLGRCDLFLAITGPYWMSRAATSDAAHWLPKTVHVDLAVDRNDFPVVKHGFAPAGQRSFVYIGNTAWYKNPDYLEEIATLLPSTQFGWIGRGDRPIRGFDALGVQDFSTEAGRELVGRFDFLVTVGSADANPTTIVEAMAWGLIPVCTRESGYSGIASIPNVPLADADRASEILRHLDRLSDDELQEMQAANWALLDDHFNWDRLCDQVVDAVDSRLSPTLDDEPVGRRLRLAWATWTGPFSPLRGTQLRLGVKALKSALFGPRPGVPS